MRKKIFIILITLILFLFIDKYQIYATDINSNLKINSDTAILMDNCTETILYSKNAYEKVYPASTTKILTAIIAIENCNLSDIATVHQSAVSAIPSGYSSADLKVDEQLSILDLINVFLVHSANDAGYVLAEHISGSIVEFSNLMNKKATEIGCKNTHFTNPSGIHNENHYTTAYDLALMTKYCMSNTTFRKIVSQKNCTVNATNKSDVRTYKNTNDLINPSSKYYLSSCIGVKTGYTSEAKNCLISYFSQNGLDLISVVLGSNISENGDSYRYVDSRALYNYGYSNYSVKSIAFKNDVVANIDIPNGSYDTKNLDLILKDDVSALIDNNCHNIDAIITLNDQLSAPIAKGSVVGFATYNINGIIYKQDLLASHTVNKEECDLYFVFIIFLIAVILILLLILMIICILKKDKIEIE